MKLELVQTEVPVGPYFLDIQAKDLDQSVLVAIENQLEETDHTHLGQLLTYATGCGVGTAIWVAPEFGYEHAQALDRLNKWTGDSVQFFGVKVEVIKNAAQSSLDARFHKVVYPGGWNKKLTLRSGEMPSITRRYYDLFQPLITELRQLGFADRVTQSFGRASRLFPSPRREGIGYEVSLVTWKNRDAAWVLLHINTGDKDQNKWIFDELQTDREAIESSIDPGSGSQWEWLRFNGAAFSQIGFSRPCSIDDSHRISWKRPEPGCWTCSPSSKKSSNLVWRVCSNRAFLPLHHYPLSLPPRGQDFASRLGHCDALTSPDHKLRRYPV